MPRSVRDYMPALRFDAGINHDIELGYGSTITASATTLLDTFIFPSSWETSRNGSVFRAVELQMSLGNTGTTSGTNTIRLIKNGDTTNGIVATASIAYNATVPYLNMSLLDSNGKGITFKAGDTLSLVVSAVAGGGSPGNLTVRVIGAVFGINK
jgi:hypothetical protein